MNIFYHQEKWHFFYAKVLYGRKMKDDLSQENTLKYGVFLIFVKDDISFSTHVNLTRIRKLWTERDHVL